jgi:septal ring factor EnvC (AmiA/AmiB activator)
MSVFTCQAGECLVQLDFGNIIAALGFLLALGVQTWALTRFMINRMDKHRDDTQKEIADVHTRINTVKDEYVKRADIDRDLNQISRGISDVNNSLNSQMTSVGNRIDILITQTINSKS